MVQRWVNSSMQRSERIASARNPLLARVSVAQDVRTALRTWVVGGGRCSVRHHVCGGGREGEGVGCPGHMGVWVVGGCIGSQRLVVLRLRFGVQG